MFCCTHAEKCVTVDHYEKGCEMNRRCCWADSLALRAEMMPELIRKINEHYALEIDSIWVGALEDGRISYNRLENAAASPPDERQIAAWKKGNLKLYLADYDFCIEKYVVHPVTVDDFAGLATHE